MAKFLVHVLGEEEERGKMRGEIREGVRRERGAYGCAGNGNARK